MDDYIRREDALRGKKTGTFANGICLVAEPCVTVEYIESLESTDVVPVVRCKECRNSEYDFVTQIRGCSWFRIPVTDDFFCAKGERKE